MHHVVRASKISHSPQKMSELTSRKLFLYKHEGAFKFIFVVGSGVMATFLTVILCLSLLSSSDKPLQSHSKKFALNFVRLEEKKDSTRRPQKPKKQAEQTKKSMATSTDISINNIKAQELFPVSSFIKNLSPISLSPLGMSEGDYFPTIKIAPIYPFSAINAGKEGECIVEYTVAADGSTKNVKPVNDKCESVFLNSSLNAVKRFKYKPRIISGQPVEVPGIKNKFIYKLEN